MLTRTIVALVLTPLFVAVLTVLTVPVLVVVVAGIWPWRPLNCYVRLT